MSTNRSPAYSILKPKLEREFRILEEQQVTPWAFLNTGKPMKVQKFDGGSIQYEGVGYSGSPRLAFWGDYMRLFLENLVDKAFTAAREFCNEHDLGKELPLEETSKELQLGCSLIYGRMAEIDQRLRGEGSPDEVPKRSVNTEIDRINKFIFERLKSELILAGFKGSNNPHCDV
jgi:hypothetical protein